MHQMRQASFEAAYSEHAEDRERAMDHFFWIGEAYFFSLAHSLMLALRSLAEILTKHL